MEESKNGFRRFRTVVRVLFYGGCACVVGFFFLCAGLFSFEGKTEFVDATGAEAQGGMVSWPPQVLASDVHLVSYKYEGTIDSGSSWYCIRLTAEAAKVWADHLHGQQEQWAARWLRDNAGYEGVHRTVPGPPPLHRQTGETPDWWSPPSTQFRATEVMLWYGHDSGVGRATYSAFDESGGTLWIYDYSCQHDILWDQGEVPEGEVFSDMRKIESPD